MKSEKFFELVLIGLVTAVPHEIITLIMKKFHVITISGFEQCSMMFMREPNWSLGFLALPMVSLLGVISFYYLTTKIIGTDHIILKAGLYGMTVNAAIFQVFGNLIGNQNLIQNTAGNYVFAFSSMCAGLFAGILIEKYLLVTK